ncbi:hypothetical protein Tco_0537031 [Tanacetum coccineum]
MGDVNMTSRKLCPSLVPKIRYQGCLIILAVDIPSVLMTYPCHHHMMPQQSFCPTSATLYESSDPLESKEKAHLRVSKFESIEVSEIEEKKSSIAGNYHMYEHVLKEENHIDCYVSLQKHLDSIPRLMKLKVAQQMKFQRNHHSGLFQSFQNSSVTNQQYGLADLPEVFPLVGWKSLLSLVYQQVNFM